MAYQMKRGSTPNFKDLGSSSISESPNKFDTDAALGGASAGAKLGSMFGPWGTVIGGVAGGAIGGFSDSFGGGGDTSGSDRSDLNTGPESTKDKIARLKEQNIKKKVDEEVNKEMAASSSETA